MSRMILEKTYELWIWSTNADWRSVHYYIIIKRSLVPKTWIQGCDQRLLPQCASARSKLIKKFEEGGDDLVTQHCTNIEFLSFNPIPTRLGHVTLIQGLILPLAGRNRVKRQTKYDFRDKNSFALAGAPVAFKTWCGRTYRVGIICPPGRDRVPQLVVDTSPYPHANGRACTCLYPTK